GYSTTMTVLVALTGGNVLPVKIEVTGPEKLTVPAGTLDCFKVELSLKQVFWCSADEHRYLVKFEAGGAMAELTGIRRRGAGETSTYRDPALRFSVTAPADWLFYHGDNDEENQTEIDILDPEVAVDA